MWWVFLPARRRTCRVMAPEVERPARTPRPAGGRRAVTEAGRVGGEGDLVGQERAPRQVEGHLDEGLVEGQEPRRRTPDSRLVAQRLGQGPPSTMPTSSTVWCRSTSRSPGVRPEVEAAVAPELLDHVVEEGEAGRDHARTRCRRGRGDLDRGLFGPVGRLRRAGGSVAVMRSPSRAARKRSFSSGVPMVTRRHPSSPTQLEQSRTSTDRSKRRCQTSCAPAPGGAEEDEVGIRGPGSTGRAARASASRSRSATIVATRVGHLVGEAAVQRCRPAGSGDRWYGRTTASQAAPRRVGDSVPEPDRRHRPGLGERADHHQAVARPVAPEAGSRGHGANWP